MKNLQKILLITFCILIVFQIKGQVKFGLKAGFNMTTFGEDAKNTVMKPGAQLGFVVNKDFHSIISIQSGLMVSLKGAKQELKTTDVTTNFVYFELPVNFIHKYKSLQFVAGPYFALGVYGKVKPDKGDELTVKFKTEVERNEIKSDEDYAKLYDIGINLGLGYEINKKMQVQASYGLGLVNTIPKLAGEEPKERITNNAIQFCFTYFFN